MDWPRCEDNTYDALQAGLEDGDPRVDLYVWFGKDPEYYGSATNTCAGKGYLGGACGPKRLSFNEWRKTPAQMSLVSRY